MNEKMKETAMVSNLSISIEYKEHLVVGKNDKLWELVSLNVTNLLIGVLYIISSFNNVL